MKKITVTVDGTGSVSLDSSDAGYYGEHFVTCLEITPAVTFSENCEYYKMNIDGYVSERLTPTDGKITYTLPGSALRPPSISCQLIGYKLIDSIPVMVIRSAVFTLNVAVSPVSESPEIINGSLQPLETALAECGNTVAAAEKLLEEITDAQGTTRTELKNLKDSAASSASSAAGSSSAAGVSAAAAAASAAEASASAANASASAASAANSASEAAASAASVNSGNYYKKSETYSKDAADKQFAERSSENSANPSSVEYAKAVWIKQDDTGTNGAAFLYDEYTESPLVLWSSGKTMETVRDTIKDAQADYYKKDETYAKSETYSKDEIYTKAETNKQFAERSSEDSIASSSVAFAQFLWVKGNDGGDDSYVELNDSHSADQQYLWSSEKTMEEVKQQFCNALKGSKSGGTVRIDDVSPANGELNVSVVRKNLIPYPYAFTTVVKKGITVTANSDGSISVNGTNDGTGTSNFFMQRIDLNKEIYVLSGGKVINTGKYASLTIDLYKSNKYVKSLTNVTADGAVIDNSDNLYDYGSLSVVVSSGVTVSDLTIKPQLETGTSATAYTPYVSDLSKVTVKAYETDPTDIKATYTPNEDGTVEGVTAISPTTTLTADNSGVVIKAEYNRDINKAFAELQQAIISLGGNL